MTNYPALNVQNENHLAKLTTGKIDKQYRNTTQMTSIIAECTSNYEDFWEDNPKQTDEEAGKFFRTCKKTNLGILLKRIDRFLLAPHDKILPCHIHGGIKGIYRNSKGQEIRKSTESAALSLVNGRGCWLIRMDLERFYEKVTKEDIFFLLHKHCGCSIRIANLIADLCTVKIGPKSKPISDKKVLARGFATSTRLAIWAKINFFLELRSELKNLCGKSTMKVVVYIDDIGVSVKTKDEDLIRKIIEKVEKIAKRHSLKINETKTKKIRPENRKEHLGCHIGNKGISADSKSLKKEFQMKQRAQKTKDPSKSKALQRAWNLCKLRIERIKKARP